MGTFRQEIPERLLSNIVSRGSLPGKGVNAVISGKTFSAKVTGLEAATSYVFRGIVGEEKGEEKEFTTEGTDQVPYMNFDSWYMSGKAVCPGVGGDYGVGYRE